MPREGTHIWRTANYAVNLRVYTRTRNNAGNFGRLHGSRGNVQRASSPRGVEARGTRANYVAFRVVYAGGAREKRRNFSCLHRQTEAGAKFNRWMNEREKGEKVHMRATERGEE